MSIINIIFRSSILNSIVMAILGVLLIFQSEITIVSISYIIGAILVAIGTAAIIKYISFINSPAKNEMEIVYGIVTIILGIIVITNPKAIASIIPIVVGLIIVVSSAAKLQCSLELKKEKNEVWKSTLIISIITMLCGILLLFNPFKGAEFLAKIIGILILLYAILDMISTVSIKRTVKHIQKALEDGITEASVIDEKTSDDDKKDSKKNKKGDK